ncbi:MAG: hypothetical protein QM790_01625 [Nibricoccus sp.]
MNGQPEMTPEEFDKWLEQNGAAMKAQAERNALNYLANQQANELARRNVVPKEPEKN